MTAGYLGTCLLPTLLALHPPSDAPISFLPSLTLLLLNPPGYLTRDPIMTHRSSDSNRTLADSASAMFGDGG
jgi:hypothetical protein